MLKANEGFMRQHIREAQTTIEGEDQLPRYVAKLDLAECAEILAASPIGLPSLAAKRDECRVVKDEERSFTAPNIVCLLPGTYVLNARFPYEQ